jgi:hypothetical protein
MAVSINQGYVRSFNLSETIDEVKSINNLAGGSISNDLSAFAGNTKNTSKVVYKPGLPSNQILENKIFRFDLLACYGNGDPIKVKAGRSISNLVYNVVNDTLSVTFNEPHGLSSTDIQSNVTLRLRDTFFDGPGTIRFNEKDYTIGAVAGTNTLVLVDIGYEGEDPGIFNTANRYPYAICSLFPLPNPLSYTQDYFVVLSNAIDRFQIATSYIKGQLVSPISINNAVNYPLIFERTNEVTQESLVNLARPEFQDDQFDYSNDVLGRSFGNNFDYLESILDAADYFRLKKYTRSLDNIFDANPIKIGGNVRTIDPDGFNFKTENLFNDKSPGIFIIDPSSQPDDIIRLRAFSDNTQPWELDQGSGTLEYAVIPGRSAANQEMSIGNMVLKGNPISMDGVQNIEIESVSGLTPPQKFTHKLPVIVNGEEYNFLLADSIS